MAELLEQQQDLGPRRDGKVGATNKSLHDQRYYKDRVCDAPKKIETVSAPKKIGSVPKAKKRVDPLLGDLDSYKVVACEPPPKLDISGGEAPPRRGARPKHDARYSETVVCEPPRRLGEPAVAAIGGGTAEDHRERGNELFKAGNAEEAGLAYATALKLDPSDAKSSANLAAVFLKQRNWSQALHFAASAVRMAQPGDAVGKWHYRVARALYGLRHFDKCVEILDRAATCDDVDEKLAADILATKKAAAAALRRRQDEALAAAT